MRRRPLALLFLFFCVPAISLGIAPAGQKKSLGADSCKWTSKAADRRKVKNRAPDPNRYPRFNNGNPITVAQFFDLVCGLNPPSRKNVPQGLAIEGVETQTIAVRGFLLAAKFERGEDHDIHAQVSDSKDWDSDQLIIEIPAGKGYCQLRKALWGLVKKDRLIKPRDKSLNCGGDTCKLVDAPEVVVIGYLFLDSHHANSKDTPRELCKKNGGRGLQKNKVNKVRGLWELHPVISFVPVNP